MHCRAVSFHADLDFAAKNKTLQLFERLERLNMEKMDTKKWKKMDMTRRSLSDRRDWLFLDNHSDRNDQMDTRVKVQQMKVRVMIELS